SLATQYPEIERFVRLRGQTWTAFNPRDRCWFLSDDGWCRIERDHGRSAKPASCRLFPFNRVFRLGDTTIVDYNAVICPLRAYPADVSDEDVGLSGRVTHDEVWADIAAVDDPSVVGTALPDIPNADTWLARERSIAAVCFDED